MTNDWGSKEERPLVAPAGVVGRSAPRRLTDRSIAFSGDTIAPEAVAKMAKGADVLVHEAIDFPAMEAFVRRRPPAQAEPN